MRLYYTLLFALLVFAAPLHSQTQLLARLPRANNDLLARLHACPSDSLRLQRAEGIALCAQSEAQLRQWQTEKAPQSRIKWCVDEFCAVDVPLNELPLWTSQAPILRIEAQRAPMQLLSLPDDTLLLQHNRLTPVHSGAGALPMPLRGSGTLVCVIDDGFDWRHPDFQHADSTTRLRYLWDQSLQSTWGETEIGYGSIWDSAAIQGGFVQQNPAAHGSHVAGIAAGNARAAQKHLGVAPESSLLWVKISEGTGSFLPRFVDAVYWSALRSQQLQMPCSINSSVGTYFGAHDGKDLHSRAIAAILQQYAGVVLSQAAGNARASQFHWQSQLQSHSDTARIWFRPMPSHPLANTALTQFIGYADTADARELHFSLQQIDGSSLFTKARTPTFSLVDSFPAADGTSNLYQHTLYRLPNGTPIAMNVYVSNYDGVYEIWIQIQSPSSQDFWQFTISGRSKMDIWSSASLVGTSDMLRTPPRTVPHYRSPDSLQSIVGYWNCSDAVISVGSYQNQTYMVNYAGDSVFLGTQGFPQGGISQFSSLGGTRDGRQKPDICASGGQVLSAAPVPDLQGFRLSNMATLDEGGWHVSNRGTSMSAPIVAGAVALYLQCNPRAHAADVLAAVRATARVDSFVFMQSSEYPNAHWGWGKLDAYALALSCLRLGCMDTLADNYDPLATVSDANACIYLPSAVDNVVGAAADWQLLPNPALYDEVYLQKPEGAQGARVLIYDLSGRQCAAAQPIESGSVRTRLDLGHLPAGVYVCTVLDAQNKRLYVGRLVKIGR